MDQHAAAADNKALSDEVLRRVGRNLLLFQQIEGLLKLLVVHHRVDGTTATLLPRQRERAEKTRMQTMGSLVKRYDEEVLPDVDKARWSHHPQAAVDCRGFIRCG